tara:strand:+ start:417 stop:674 length:258 start_codon:yes stop_codon:yes gene_type:complete
MEKTEEVEQNEYRRGSLEAVNECRPSTIEVLRDHEISIRFLSRGCVVRVGCKEIPFESIENGMVALNNYVNNPYEERIKWEEKLK